MNAHLEALRQKLRDNLHAHSGLIVAYSGGVDSAYLAWEARQVLGDRMLAAIAVSPSLSQKHLSEATAFVRAYDIPLRMVHTDEMARPEYVRNDSNRCYYCKDELFTLLGALAQETGLATIAYGRNRDDSSEHRPGQRAADLHRSVAPLAEAELGKAEVRELARHAGLSVWNKPASACLSSRLEYGRPVTAKALWQIEESEESLMRMGFRQVRVRHHGELARIEIERSELPKALSIDMLRQINKAVRAAGFIYATLDMEGYRSGSMNAILPVESLTAGAGRIS